MGGAAMSAPRNLGGAWAFMASYAALETMTLLTVTIAILAAAGFILALWLAYVVLEVMVGLIRQGPRAIDQAHKRGDSVKAWLDPSRAPLRTGPHHEYRKARAGRKHAKLGVVSVTERASTHFYGR
jgi:hypothetical protein